MDFNLTDDFVKDNELNENQVKAVSETVNTFVADAKKEWDGKANENAEGIISGVIKATQTKFGVELDRQQGEKHADYLTRLSEMVVGGTKEKLEAQILEYEQKMKDVKGNEALTKEYEALKANNEELLKKYADYDTLAEKASKLDDAEQTLSTLKLEVAFNGVKPNFPQEVNSYEAKAKWQEFKNGVLEKNTIEIVDNEYWAIDKENHYKKTKLKDLVSGDESLSELMKGRQQSGTGAKPVDLKEVDGVPFKVPANATTKDVSKLIREHLAKQNIGTTHNDYAKLFAEYNQKILQGQTQAA